MATGAPRLSGVLIAGIDLDLYSLSSRQIPTCSVQTRKRMGLVELLHAAVNLVDCTIHLYGTPTHRLVGHGGSGVLGVTFDSSVGNSG